MGASNGHEVKRLSEGAEPLVAFQPVMHCGNMDETGWFHRHQAPLLFTSVNVPRLEVPHTLVLNA